MSQSGVLRRVGGDTMVFPADNGNCTHTPAVYVTTTRVYDTYANDGYGGRETWPLAKTEFEAAHTVVCTSCGADLPYTVERTADGLRLTPADR